MIRTIFVLLGTLLVGCSPQPDECYTAKPNGYRYAFKIISKDRFDYLLVKDLRSGKKILAHTDSIADLHQISCAFLEEGLELEKGEK